MRTSTAAASRKVPPRSVFKQIGIVLSTYCKWYRAYEMEGVKGGEGQTFPSIKVME